jgi:superoxide dismutase, Fe-Mn family
MSAHTRLLGADVREDACDDKSRYRAADYLEVLWNVVDWSRVAERHAAAIEGGRP